MEVHRTLGYGFPEVIYQRALAYEFSLNGIEFQREPELDVWYKEKCIGTRRVDFLVGEIAVELKARSELESQHFAQTLNYLEVYDLEIGLLINFGAKSLKYHRLTNKKFKSGSKVGIIE